MGESDFVLTSSDKWRPMKSLHLGRNAAGKLRGCDLGCAL